MKLDLGEHVRTNDGKDVGTIDQLILDPANGDIKSAVVRKGFFLPRDVEIPIEVFDREIGDGIQLTFSADQIDRLPDFDESNYTNLPPANYALPGGYAADSIYFPMGAVGMAPAAPMIMSPPPPVADTGLRQEVDAALTQQDVENAVVGKDSVVQSSDGDIVGSVHDLVFDPRSRRLASIVVREGMIFTHDHTLPASLIDRVDDGIVYLKASTRELKDSQD